MSDIEEIKNRLNILDIVSSYVKLAKTGVNYRGVCPFHSEKGPSFFVSPSRQMFKCFGCGAGGDIFEFVKRIEGVEFGDALRILAAKAGVEVKRENPQVQSERQRLYEICELGCKFFEKQLEASSIGKEAKDYLLKRGIKEENIKKWRLGYSPDMWQGLSDFLVGRGYNRNEIVKAGLAVPSEKNKNPYDRFRGRIIFPIFDANSQVIGFGARVFKVANEKETAKYINTPQTMLYDKSNVLYGINFARVPVRKNNQCVLVEGYTDAIMCHQAGFENTVAVSGTALTPRHLTILKRYSENLLLAFDMDSAGTNAINRGIDMAISDGFNIKVINLYKNAKDPAEIILENPENWAESVKKATDIMEFSFNSTFAKFDKNSPAGRKEIENALYPRIAILPNAVEKAKQIQRIAQEFEVAEDIIFQAFKDWQKKNQKQENTRHDSSGQTQKNISPSNIPSAEKRKNMLEEKVVSLILKDPANLQVVEDSHHQYFSPKTKNIIESFKKIAADPAFASSNSALSESQEFDSEIKSFLATLALKAEVEFEGDDSGELVICIDHLKDIYIKDRRKTVSGQIRQAETQGDQEKVKTLMEEFKLIN